MTTHTDAPADDLVARLNSTFLRFNMGHREEPLRNPDGPEAAARIRSLEAQRDEAVGLLTALKIADDHAPPMSSIRRIEWWRKQYKPAMAMCRALLERLRA